MTGFAPFGGSSHNPSEALARQVCELGSASGLHIASRVLAVTPSAVDEFIAEMLFLRPRCILAMGETSDEPQFEHSAQNALKIGRKAKVRRIDAAMGKNERIPSDISMNLVEQALASSRPPEPQRGDVNTLSSALAKRAWFQSDDSGYLCNYMNFKLAQAFGADDDVEAGFVHVNEDTPPAQILAIIQAVTNQK